MLPVPHFLWGVLALVCFLRPDLGFCHQAPLQIDRDAILDEDTAEFVQRVLADWGSLGGAGIAVVRKEGDQWKVESRGYGKADLAGTPVNEDTLFSIGSNSKLFASIATGILISNESLTPRLTWKTKLADVIPDWKLVDPIASQETTIIDAMSHRTGLPRHDFAYAEGDSVQTLVNRLQNLPSSTTFRDSFQYNNMMYMVLSSLPTILLPTKPPFVHYVKENIFDRLNWTDTTFSFYQANSTGRFARGIAREGLDYTNPIGSGIPRTTSPPSTPPGENGNVVSAAGGILSTAKELTTWLQVLLLNGLHPTTNETVIPSQVVDMVSTGYSIAEPKAEFPELSPSVYGGGLFRESYRGYEMIEHGGRDIGYLSWILRIPSKGLGVAILMNDDLFGYYLMHTIGYYIVDKALGLEPIDWNGRFLDLTRTSYSEAATKLAMAKNEDTTHDLSYISSLAGVYSHPGYGTIDLCFVPPVGTRWEAKRPVSRGCKELSVDIHRKLPKAAQPGVPMLIAHWRKLFSSHLVLAHFQDNLFNVSTASSMPTGDSAYPFWSYGADFPTGWEAQFASGDDQGFGFLGGFWGAGVGVESPQGKTERERAEIWFEKE
ncbi:beta-lactamase/transpeptidase-like protein [Pluteus cervinus]|uniref:Beta-lactamase/transpeptidase-like protein n=1 Tax=Pluteus cervinus TaxID=181527 RepID=A0ACD3AZT8_9AGAR|nr:beta-lactamase/transpeptidase-like protein [Pluteus cervinus]